MKESKRGITRRDSLKLVGGMGLAAITMGAAPLRGATNSATAPATKDIGSVVQGRFALDRPIVLDPIRNYYILPGQVTFRKKDKDLVATVRFIVNLPPEKAKQQDVRAHMFLMDDEGKHLAEQQAEVPARDLEVKKEEAGGFVLWTVTGQGTLTFPALDLGPVRWFELKLLAH